MDDKTIEKLVSKTLGDENSEGLKTEAQVMVDLSSSYTSDTGPSVTLSDPKSREKIELECSSDDDASKLFLLIIKFTTNTKG